ncbi:MAG: hypothetical protein ACYC69_02855 [Thermodesulfovibrionales bacterium]
MRRWNDLKDGEERPGYRSAVLGLLEVPRLPWDKTVMKLSETQQRRITNEIDRAKEDSLREWEITLKDIEAGRARKGLPRPGGLVSEEAAHTLEFSKRFISQCREIYLDILAPDGRPIDDEMFEYVMNEINARVDREREDFLRLPMAHQDWFLNLLRGVPLLDPDVLDVEIEIIRGSARRDLEIERDQRAAAEDKRVREALAKGQERMLASINRSMDRTIDRFSRRPEVTVDRKKDIVPPAFDFIVTKELIPILQRDYVEIVRCMDAGCWKAAIILCGSCIEGILFDLLKQNELRALNSKKAQKDREKKTPLALEKWDLNFLIEVALDLRLIGKEIRNLHDSAREYRNLIHPAKEVTSPYKIDKPEATNFIAVLDMLIRDITSKGEKHDKD